jgi:predicted RNA-binding protein with PIN domain
MRYLIDGHNLISKLPDISLDDPNDEMKLVLRLKSWASASRKRRITLIFDGGLPGGKSVSFSNNLVKVIFASVGRTADDLLIRRIQKAKNPAEFMLVSSDRAIIAVAKARRMPYQRSEEFASTLGEAKRPARSAPPEDSSPGELEKPEISKAEVDEWLELFGPEPEPRPAKQKQVKKPSPKEQTMPEKRKRPRKLTTEKRIDRKLHADEIEDWLKLFETGDD